MKISIIGTGYVGLVSGLCLTAKGHSVVCVDVDQAKVDLINSGHSPIHEKGLGDLIRDHVGKRFHASTDLRTAVESSDLSIIAVGTPFHEGEIDLHFIRVASEKIGEALAQKESYHVVVVKSTVVPGTTNEVVVPILERSSGKVAGRDFGVGMNPEFLREGEAVNDFLHPDRIVIGGIDERTLNLMNELYQPFSGIDLVRTNPRTAEMIKYTANSLLATMISFSNEMANLCASVPGVDIIEVMHGVHLDKRICPIQSDGGRIKPSFTSYLEAGCGFGGSCFPKDVKALVAHGRKVGQPMNLLNAVVEVNMAQPNKIISLLSSHFNCLRNLRVTVLGVAFKPGTDDIRESPALAIISTLLDRKACVTVFDPIARNALEKHFGSKPMDFAASLEAAVTGSHVVLLLTSWPEFECIPKLFSEMLEQPLLIDGRRMLDRFSVEHYEGIGLGPVGAISNPVLMGWGHDDFEIVSGKETHS
jgi:UDPglucose 6-dehydrogenase